MTMKQQKVTLVVAYDDDYQQPPSDWDWDYESDSSSAIRIVEYGEVKDYDEMHPAWRMSAKQVV